MHSVSKSRGVVLVLMLLLRGGATFAQSGGSVIRGYVHFEGVADDDIAKKNIHAKVELQARAEGNGGYAILIDPISYKP
jgi:hypothetical protein